VSAQTRAEIWARLAGAGLVHGDLPPPRPAAPWYVRLMQGGSGWLGALLLLAFLGGTFSFLFEDVAGAFLGGAAACAGATLAFRRWPDSDFAGQLGFAVSLAGQALLGYGLWELLGERLGVVAAAMAAVQVALFVLVPNFLHRVWSAWTAAFAAWLAMLDAGVGPLVPGLLAGAFAALWLAEPELAHYGERTRAAGWGLALATVQFPIFGWLLWDLPELLAFRLPLLGTWVGWAGVGISALVLVAVVLQLLLRQGHSPATRPGAIALAGAVIVALTTLKAPGLAPAVVVLLVGFAAGSRELAGLGILALLAYLSRYYYALNATLLDKSLLMMTTGAALLLVRLAQRKLCLCPTEEGSG
jgi:hypothetical protein